MGGHLEGLLGAVAVGFCHTANFWKKILDWVLICLLESNN